MTKEFKGLFDLDGRTAIVTGGAGLLGPEHAMSLVDFGARVFLVDKDNARLGAVMSDMSNVYQESIFPVCCDITDFEAVNEFARKLKGSFNPSILVNNAALNPKMDSREVLAPDLSVEKYELGFLRQEIEVSIIGTLICSQIFGAIMSKNRHGSIINISSDLSVISPDNRIYSDEYPNIQPNKVKPLGYPVVKTALIGLTRYLATYWASSGVRVNAISPGGVLDNQSTSLIERINHLVPMGRMAKKNEFRSAVIFLASDSSSYITGQNLIIDGGRSVW